MRKYFRIMAKRIMKLTNKQKVFVEEYLKCWNTAEASRRAGYSERTARTNGSRLLTNADIKAYIEERLKEKILSSDEVLVRLSDQARANMADLINENGEFDLMKAKRLGVTHLIQEIKVNKSGDKSIKLYSAQSALQLTGKYHALFTDVTIKVERELEEALAKLETNLDTETFKKVIEALSSD